MTIGTSIFLSAILICGVILYIFTKDRWRWKRIMLWAISVSIAFVAMCFAIYLSYLMYSNHPKLQSTLWGVNLGSSKDDVIFLKGKPIQRDVLTDSATFYYGEDNVIYEIFLSKDKVIAIVCHPEFRDSCSLQNIRLGDSCEKVISKFGRPTKISKTDDGLSRVYHFARYKVCFGFTKGVVVSFGIEIKPSLGLSNPKQNGNKENLKPFDPSSAVEVDPSKQNTNSQQSLKAYSDEELGLTEKSK